MNNETKVADSDTTDSGNPSRRTLVRTAAWSVPVISSAAIAPSFAAASTLGTLTFSVGPTATSSKNKELDVNLTIKNGSTTSATQGLQVSVKFPSAPPNASYSGASVASMTAGWTVVKTTPQSGGVFFVFTAPLTGQAAQNNGTSSLTFKIRAGATSPVATTIEVITMTTNSFTQASNTNVSAPAL